jgi:hypothetical protein
MSVSTESRQSHNERLERDEGFILGFDSDLTGPMKNILGQPVRVFSQVLKNFADRTTEHPGEPSKLLLG